MPNHCSNYLCVVDEMGSAVPSANFDIHELLVGLTDEIDGEPTISFQKIRPMNEELLNTECPTSVTSNKIGMPDWYKWRLKNWGTKWEAYDGSWIDGYHAFTTAWSPPEALIQHLAEKTGKYLLLAYLGEGFEFLGETWFSPKGKAMELTYEPYAPNANGTPGYQAGAYPERLQELFDLNEIMDSYDAMYEEVNSASTPNE
jgi:hypothetical protein